MKKKIIGKESRINNIFIIVIFVIFISVFCFSMTPKTLQNDTYYTIKIGELIKNQGIDMMDHFSWHENLKYTYPHWLYDLMTYIVYSFLGMNGIYIMTCILSIILGNSIFFVNYKLNKNKALSFIITIGTVYLMKDYIAARAQLITFILFIWEIYCIEKFLETRKIRFGIGLIIIPTIIANVHLAVFPFYFVLYLPYIAEYLIENICEIILYKKIEEKLLILSIKRIKNKKLMESNLKQKEEKLERLKAKVEKIKEKREKNLENPYKVLICKNENVKYLIIIMLIAMLTGFITPLGDTPYTYLVKTMKGNTTQNIQEHLPLILAKNIKIGVLLIIFFSLAIFSKVKIRLSDLFMLGGLLLLMFITKRQESMFSLIGLIILNKWIIEISNQNDPKWNPDKDFFIEVIAILLFLFIVHTTLDRTVKNKSEQIIDETSYPVSACDFIIENINLDNVKFYNQYNYGSYMLFRGIPVFIDSRADLYAPEFSSKDEDIFTDFLDIDRMDKFYEDTFEKYGITHVILNKSSKINLIIERTEDKNYKELYSDEYFIIYERVSAKK